MLQVPLVKPFVNGMPNSLDKRMNQFLGPFMGMQNVGPNIRCVFFIKRCVNLNGD